MVILQPLPPPQLSELSDTELDTEPDTEPSLVEPLPLPQLPLPRLLPPQP